MTKDSVYLLAAEEIDGNLYGFSCLQILHSGGGRQERCKYAELFCPFDPVCEYIEDGWWCGYYTQENNDCRVLALLFMHWISLDEPAP